MTILEQIHAVFGDVQLRLERVIDPEGEGESTLTLGILTDEPVGKALARLEKFDGMGMHPDVCVTLEFAEDAVGNEIDPKQWEALTTLLTRLEYDERRDPDDIPPIGEEEPCLDCGEIAGHSAICSHFIEKC